MREQDKWSEEESAILIEAYRNKWYYLKLGNLNESDWQDVADEVMARCNTHKTARECWCQMGYLRKCYREEVQRGRNPEPQMDPFAWVDTWVHFHRMDFLENGYWLLNLNADPVKQEKDGGGGENQEVYYSGLQTKNPGLILDLGADFGSGHGSGSGQVFGSGQGFGCVQGFGSSQSLEGGYIEGGFGFGKMGSGAYGSVHVSYDDSLDKIVAPMETWNDGFVPIKRMKMEETTEVESLQMEVEMKGKGMILESNQRSGDFFSWRS